ncbi:MAG: hypothetical protein ACRCU2_19335 [Planktothrix sp.]
METELETAIIKAISVHNRLPRTIQKALYHEYGAVVELEVIIDTLKALESQGKVRRYSLPSGRITDTWEAVKL